MERHEGKKGDRVRLVEDRPEYGLRVGDVGTMTEDNDGAPFVQWDRKDDLIAVVQSDLELIPAAQEWKPRVGERVRMTKVVDGNKADCGATVIFDDGGTYQPFVIKFDEKQDWAHTADSRTPDLLGYWVTADDIEPITDDAPVVAEAQPALTITAGRYYRTRDGRKAGPAEPYNGNPSEYCWKVQSEGNGHFVYTSDGRYSTGGYWPENDLIAEWVDEPTIANTTASNDNAAPATPKFKVGDVVRVKSAYDTHQDRYIGTKFTIDSDEGDFDGEHSWSGRDHESPYRWKESQLELVPVVEPTAIVALIENGTAKPASRPKVHADQATATKEAERLALQFPGQKFGVFVLADSKMADVVNVPTPVLRAA